MRKGNGEMAGLCRGEKLKEGWRGESCGLENGTKRGKSRRMREKEGV